MHKEFTVYFSHVLRRKVNCREKHKFDLSAKRIFDIFISLFGMVLLSPLFLLIYAIVKLDSPGPAFFIQYRAGYKGEIFKMYKFRTMTVNAEKLLKTLSDLNDVEGPVFKIKNDPRITRAGRFLRKTSLDELPQLLNVLRGNMSLVGPRPPLASEVEKYEGWQKMRLLVKPGMTGLWQVSGRNALNFHEMVTLDLKYIREMSFFYDLKILLKTLPLLFGDKNAY